MELKRLTKQAEISRVAELMELDVQVETESHAVKRIVLSYGQTKLIIQGEYGLNVFTPAPPKLVKRFLLSGKYKGLLASELFETKSEAEAAQQEIEGDDFTKYVLKITEHEVTEEKADEMKAKTQATAPTTEEAMCPF